MSFTDLVEMFHIARSLAFIVNERAAQDTHSEAQTIADVWARSILSADDGKHPDSAKFCNWAKKNCPRVFDGIHHWVARTLLSKGFLRRAVVKGFHGIPCLPEHAAQNHTLLNKETLWILSTILPPCFLGNVSQAIGSREQQSTNPDEEKAIVCLFSFCFYSFEWFLLLQRASTVHNRDGHFSVHCNIYSFSIMSSLCWGITLFSQIAL